MKSSSGSISIAASAQRLDVDNRISLRYYYRIADNLIKQANIYREENDIIDLYVMLLRFSSLISETIPYHRDYQASLQSERLYFRKKLLGALNELEALKPDVQQKLQELNRKTRTQVNRWGQAQQNGFVDNSLEWPPLRKQTLRNNESSQVNKIIGRDGTSWGKIIQHDRLPLAKPGEEQFRKISLSIPCPKEETLSRHSILGPNGLQGEWKPPSIDKGIQYPSNLDLSPIEIPSLTQPAEDKPVPVKDNGASGNEASPLEVLLLHDGRTEPTAEPCPMINLDATETLMIDITREPSPPPVLAEVQDVLAVTPQVSNSTSGQTILLQDELVQTGSPLQVHISTTMMENFMRLAKSNTVRNLETCGVLAGSLGIALLLQKNRKFFVTALIIPKQESTSDSCQTTNEEEIFDYQDKHSLFPLGWIHTHPTQSCFMSSIDVHTHYSYQIMLPEAIAIVMAPKDGSRSLSIPCPKEETLSRHSILGPNGLQGEWKPPSIDKGIQYPSNLDLSPIEIPSLTQPAEDKPVPVKDNGASGNEASPLEVLLLHDGRTEPTAEPCPMINLDATETLMIDITREPSPPPVLAEVQDVLAVTPQVSNSTSGQTILLQDELVQTGSPLQVHISTTMMENFMRLAKSNTVRNLETCGVLAGSLGIALLLQKNRKFFVTALIIPKQESTSDSCQTTNEEEIFDYQDKHSLFPLGWIHTHPTQSCFMSSIDVHTHYSYQIMLPEAIAIVMAPKDGSRTHGIFRLTSPGGMSVIRQCQQRGFHPHKEPPDGGRIYDHCSDVYMNPNLKFDVVDLR
ncbi:putative AMSH-like ubiquitin thioesterase 1 [Cocos nucifera]|uniref:Putative AMSH-like ubiquitin thioesterase 1 n=1 Tax=Cocos nucifera TaxID=13894 RepID=A0A8K0HYK4_COCNU|nr:putative AMSH-like ubiquitin thioesterase 1 [Cocos nucifera]